MPSLGAMYIEEVDGLKREVERLHLELRGWMENEQQRYSELTRRAVAAEAEVVRLRAALHTVWITQGETLTGQIARKALLEGEK